jgi:hypothetical protein
MAADAPTAAQTTNDRGATTAGIWQRGATILGAERKHERFSTQTL